MRKWLFYITVFLTLPLLSFSKNYSLFLLQKELHRDIYSSHIFKTKHFNIYWSNSYPKNDIWLNSDEKNNLPLFVNSLILILENSYNIYLENNLTLPKKINVYILNTDLNATNPPLPLNSISSLGAFTSDVLPEILINANIDSAFIDGHYLSYKERLKSIVLHELMHAHQYQLGLIKKEDSNNKNLWFIEGMAVAFQLYYSDDIYFKKIFTNYLSKNINKGFLYNDYYLSYSAGLFYSFLVKKGYITFREFYPDNLNKLLNQKEYFDYLAKVIGKNIYSLFYEFYKSLKVVGKNGDKKRVEFGGAYIADENATYFIKGFKPKNLIKGDYLIGNGEIKKSKIKDFVLFVKKGWNIYISPFKIDENYFAQIDGIIWKYDNKKWSCRGNDRINSLCKKYYGLIKIINPNEGFWIYSNGNYDIQIDSNFTQEILFYKKGWNLSGNGLDNSIDFNSSYLVWKYENGKWDCSYFKNIKINPYEGFWIYRR